MNRNIVIIIAIIISAILGWYSWGREYLDWNTLKQKDFSDIFIKQHVKEFISKYPDTSHHQELVKMIMKNNTIESLNIVGELWRINQNVSSFEKYPQFAWENLDHNAVSELHLGYAQIFEEFSFSKTAVDKVFQFVQTCDSEGSTIFIKLWRLLRDSNKFENIRKTLRQCLTNHLDNFVETDLRNLAFSSFGDPLQDTISKLLSKNVDNYHFHKKGDLLFEDIVKRGNREPWLILDVWTQELNGTTLLPSELLIGLWTKREFRNKLRAYISCLGLKQNRAPKETLKTRQDIFKYQRQNLILIDWKFTVRNNYYQDSNSNKEHKGYFLFANLHIWTDIGEDPIFIGKYLGVPPKEMTFFKSMEFMLPQKIQDNVNKTFFAEVGKDFSFNIIGLDSFEIIDLWEDF